MTGSHQSVRKPVQKKRSVASTFSAPLQTLHENLPLTSGRNIRKSDSVRPDEDFGFKPKVEPAGKVATKTVKMNGNLKSSKSQKKNSRETKQVRKIDISAPIPIDSTKNGNGNRLPVSTMTSGPTQYVPETVISTMKLEMQPVKKQKSIASKGKHSLHRNSVNSPKKVNLPKIFQSDIGR